MFHLRTQKTIAKDIRRFGLKKRKVLISPSDNLSLKTESGVIWLLILRILQKYIPNLLSRNSNLFDSLDTSLFILTLPCEVTLRTKQIFNHEMKFPRFRISKGYWFIIIVCIFHWKWETGQCGNWNVKVTWRRIFHWTNIEYPSQHVFTTIQTRTRSPSRIACK